MNDKIKALTEKYNIIHDCIGGMSIVTFGKVDFQRLIFEICQEQINECAKHDVVPMNYKNIAE